MDQYTQKTKLWLDERFRKTDESGIYHAHQPIYGFRMGYSESTLTERYLVTYQIMKALSHLKCNSLLDVGAAEGYKAYVAKKIFNIRVECSDLSEEACKRAEEIFQIKSRPADIHDLPYDDEEFDAIICSETLEHVSDLDKAMEEMLRVAKKALIITIPHEPKETIEKSISKKRPHSHLYTFNLNSFNFITERYGFQILSRKINNTLLRIPAAIVDGMPRKYSDKMPVPKVFIDLNNIFVALFRKIFGRRTAAFLIGLDDMLCKIFPKFNAILFIILKDKQCYRTDSATKFSANQIIKIAVPYHYLK